MVKSTGTKACQDTQGLHKEIKKHITKRLQHIETLTYERMKEKRHTSTQVHDKRKWCCGYSKGATSNVKFQIWKLGCWAPASSWDYTSLHFAMIMVTTMSYMLYLGSTTFTGSWRADIAFVVVHHPVASRHHHHATSPQRQILCVIEASHSSIGERGRTIHWTKEEGQWMFLNRRGTLECLAEETCYGIDEEGDAMAIFNWPTIEDKNNCKN